MGILGQEQNAVETAWSAHPRADGTAPGTSLTPARRARDEATGGHVVARSVTASIPRAIASAVLHAMLLTAARRAGNVVPVATATTYAKREEASYESSVAAGTVPPRVHGETVAEAFGSPRAIEAYRNSLTIDREEAAIAGTSTRHHDRTPALARWMSANLGEQRVTISGVRGLTVDRLPKDLPPGE